MFKRCSLLAVLSVCFGLASCQKTVKISGNVSGKANKTIYLEQLSAPGVIIDSAKLSDSGEFNLKYKFQNNDPQFLILRLEGDRITLLTEKGENIRISALMNLANSYQVEGSQGSVLLHDLQQSMGNAYRSIDSLYSVYSREQDSLRRDEILKDIKRTYIRQKQQTIRFIVFNANSMAAITALYQKLPNGMGMFEEPNDIAYFKMVSDSLKTRYPNSIYVRSLNKDVEQQSNRRKVVNMLLSAMNDTPISHPDIVMQDMFSKTHRLSDLKGKVVILSFWSSDADANNNMLNRELLEIYDTYRSKGLEIYQVSLDQSKTNWINAVNTQKLPWISVCDFKGFDSPAAKVYNVSNVPFNYIIDRNGNIKGKNIWGSDLIRKVQDLL